MKEIYRAAHAACGVEPFAFLEAFNLGLRALTSRFDDRFLTASGETPAAVTDLGGAFPLFDEYREPLLDFVCYTVTKDGQREVEFLAKSDIAYRRVWRRLARGTVVKKEVW